MCVRPTYAANSRVCGVLESPLPQRSCARRAERTDDRFEVELAGPKELGGRNDGTDPEQLVASGYAECVLGLGQGGLGLEIIPRHRASWPARGGGGGAGQEDVSGCLYSNTVRNNVAVPMRPERSRF
jgi:hypothetical protein